MIPKGSGPASPSRGTYISIINCPEFISWTWNYFFFFSILQNVFNVLATILTFCIPHYILFSGCLGGGGSRQTPLQKSAFLIYNYRYLCNRSLLFIIIYRTNHRERLFRMCSQCVFEFQLPVAHMTSVIS